MQYCNSEHNSCTNTQPICIQESLSYIVTSVSDGDMANTVCDATQMTTVTQQLPALGHTVSRVPFVLRKLRKRFVMYIWHTLYVC